MNGKSLLTEKIREIVLEVKNEFSDIVITIPASIDWSEYKKEIDTVKDGSNVMNFKISNFPKRTKEGCKCYLCYKGNIIGWMKIVGMREKEFTCSTTGKKFKGKFIERSGTFNYIEPIQMKGFQGFRYFSENN
jgi:hypothetical protein